MLGLRRRFDIGENFFEFCAVCTGIKAADGVIPAAGGTVRICLRQGEIISILPDIDITVIRGDMRFFIPAGGRQEFSIEKTGGKYERI